MGRYDVVIVGGGLGGLACGAILSKEGLSVCVLEQHSTIGGCLQSFRRRDVAFDTGMHYVGSLSAGQVAHQYFKYFGIIDSLRLQKLSEEGYDVFHFPDGQSYSHAVGFDRFIDNLAEEFPEECRGLQSLCSAIQQVGSLVVPSVLQRGKLSDGGGELLSVSAYGEICRHVRNEKLRNVLAGSCTLYAGDKQTTSLYEYGMVMHSNIEGPYSFVDGSQQIADALTRVIRGRGGEVLCSSRVAKIHLDGAMVQHVELENRELIRAKHFISSLHPTATFAMLENNTIYKKAFFSRINSLPNTYGIFTTYLRMKPNAVKYLYRNHYFYNQSDVWSLGGSYGGCNISSVLLCMQPNSASEHVNCISLLSPMPLAHYAQWIGTKIGKRGAEYEEFKQRFSEAQIDFVAQFLPHLKGSIEQVYTASPLTYQSYTSTPQGSAYGIVKDYRNAVVSHFPPRTRIDNLLLTGQSLNIHGCIGTVVSAAVTCAEIVGNEYLAKKIAHA